MDNKIDCRCPKCGGTLEFVEHTTWCTSHSLGADVFCWQCNYEDSYLVSFTSQLGEKVPLEEN